MPLFNNSPEMNLKSEHFISSNKSQKIQLKKKPHCIKLEVNKLIKPESQKNYSIKNNHSQHSSHQISSQFFDPNQSVEKEIQSHPKHFKSMNFEELYFQKIKELRQKENASDDNKVKPIINTFFIESELKVPISCKSSQSTKNKTRVAIKKHVELTKNYNCEKNKENSQISNVRVSSATPIKHSETKFFKKASPLQNNLTILNNSNSIEKHSKEEKSKTEKGKKVLKLKKTKGRTKSDFFFNTSIEKESDHIAERNSLSSMEKPSFSPVNEQPNISEELNKIRLSTPSQSEVSKCQWMDSATKESIKEIIDRSIDHSKHEHVWSGIECFFSFEEFKMILCGLGFDGKDDQNIEFYVRMLWEHLGGDLYGGIVKKNMIEFLSIVFEEYSQDFKEDNIVIEQSSLPKDFVESSSLKLIKFNQQLRDQLRAFYFPLRMRKIALKLDDPFCSDSIPNNPKNSPNLSEKVEIFHGERNVELTKFEIKDTSNEKNKDNGNSLLLENNPYLDSVSVKSRQPEVSPCLISKSDSFNSTETYDMVTDFSPKLSKQQYESFQSTILPKDAEKLSTELSLENEIEFKSNRKALLSVDVNLGEGTLEKIVVYEGQDPYEVSLQLKQRYNIDEELREKFEALLKNHLKTLLFKIEEVSEELFEDSLELKDNENSNDFIVMDKESIF